MVAAGVTSYSLSRSADGLAWRYRVVASGWDNATSAPSNSVSLTDSILAPVSNVSVAPSSGGYTLSWTLSGGTTNGFLIEYRKEGDAQYTSVAVSGSTSSYAFSNLSPGSTYYFRVAGTQNSLVLFQPGSTSAWSDLVTLQTSGSLLPVPTPANLAATNIDATSLDLAWTSGSPTPANYSVFAQSLSQYSTIAGVTTTGTSGVLTNCCPEPPMRFACAPNHLTVVFHRGHPL